MLIDHSKAYAMLRMAVPMYVALNADSKGNVVIGGSLALGLHGLEIPKEPGDVDIIVYSPDDRQKSILNTLAISCSPSPGGTYTSAERRSHKYSKMGVDIDVLVEHHSYVPNDLLLFPFQTQLLKIQSISEIIKARAGYGTEFIRRKDVVSCSALEALNFNLDEPNKIPEIKSQPLDHRILWKKICLINSVACT